MEEELGMRQFGSVIGSKSIRPCLTLCARYTQLRSGASLVYTVDSPLGMADLMELTHIDRPDLKDAPFHRPYRTPS